MSRWLCAGAVVFAAALEGACGGSGSMGPMAGGPGGGGGGSSPVAGAAFMAMSPVAGATAVATSTPVMLRFSAAMAEGMEQYVDLHVRDLSGPVVGMSCAWSEGRTVLTCTPSAPLAARTTYAVHLGGGMMSAGGLPVDYTKGLAMGGQWIMGGMMSGTHAGMGWGMMGSGWRNANGSYGMVFTFTTA
jgi:Bacterial Ig-like domain